MAVEWGTNVVRTGPGPSELAAKAALAAGILPAGGAPRATVATGAANHHRPAGPPPVAASNPSKRHRERLNGELETVASLLPYDEPTTQRLDKLSVLRLAVSFLQIKAHFQVCTQLASLQPSGRCLEHPFANLRPPLGPVPSLVDPLSRMPSLDCNEPVFRVLAQKALGAFLLILHLDGDIFYVTENIEIYLGFQQSDVLHQPLFEMVHSEDREELRTLLQAIHQLSAENKTQLLADWSVPIVLRFRCLLDNTCGFIRVELRCRVLNVHSHQSSGLSTFVPPSQPPSPALGRPRDPGNQQQQGHDGPNRLALIAICIPFVPPLQMDARLDDPILKSKHTLDLSFQCMDMRLRQILELDRPWDGPSSSSAAGTSTSAAADSSAADGPQNLYHFVHPADAKFLSEAHESVIKYCSSGLMIYRLVSVRSQLIYYMQSSFRLFFKNGKPDSIGANHRILTEMDGESLLEKRSTLKFKFLSFDDTLLQSPRIFQQQQQQTSGHSPNPQAQSSSSLGMNEQNRIDPGTTIASTSCGNNQYQQQTQRKTNNNSSSSAGSHERKMKKSHKKGAANAAVNNANAGVTKEQQKSSGKENKKLLLKPAAAEQQLHNAAAMQPPPPMMVGPYHAQEPLPFGGQFNDPLFSANGNSSIVPFSAIGTGTMQPTTATNNAAALFAAAHQLQQNNFLPSATLMGSILSSSSSSSTHHHHHHHQTANIDTAVAGNGNNVNNHEHQHIAAIDGNNVGQGWPPMPGAGGTGGGPPQSAGLPLSANARLKRTQMTVERYYAETVDLSPYYYQCWPSSASMMPAAAAQLAHNNPIGGNSLMMVDLSGMAAATNYGAQHQQQEEQNPSTLATADYWTSMMAAAAAAGAVDPYSAAACSSQHFTFPPPAMGTADLLAASSVLYWPQQHQQQDASTSIGLDHLHGAATASLPLFYPSLAISNNDANVADDTRYDVNYAHNQQQEHGHHTNNNINSHHHQQQHSQWATTMLGGVPMPTAMIVEPPPLPAAAPLNSPAASLNMKATGGNIIINSGNNNEDNGEQKRHQQQQQHLIGLPSAGGENGTFPPPPPPPHLTNRDGRGEQQKQHKRPNNDKPSSSATMPAVATTTMTSATSTVSSSIGGAPFHIQPQTARLTSGGGHPSAVAHHRHQQFQLEHLPLQHQLQLSASGNSIQSPTATSAAAAAAANSSSSASAPASSSGFCFLTEVTQTLLGQ